MHLLKTIAVIGPNTSQLPFWAFFLLSCASKRPKTILATLPRLNWFHYSALSSSSDFACLRCTSKRVLGLFLGVMSLAEEHPKAFSFNSRVFSGSLCASKHLPTVFTSSPDILRFSQKPLCWLGWHFSIFSELCTTCPMALEATRIFWSIFKRLLVAFCYIFKEGP